MGNWPSQDEAAILQELAGVFAGESQANRKYLAFTKKVARDGYPQAAKLFRAAAVAETVHAHAHLRAMGGIRSTQKNLQVPLPVKPMNSRTCIPI